MLLTVVRYCRTTEPMLCELSLWPTLRNSLARRFHVGNCRVTHTARQVILSPDREAQIKASVSREKRSSVIHPSDVKALCAAAILSQTRTEWRRTASSPFTFSGGWLLCFGFGRSNSQPDSGPADRAASGSATAAHSLRITKAHSTGHCSGVGLNADQQPLQAGPRAFHPPSHILRTRHRIMRGSRRMGIRTVGLPPVLTARVLTTAMSGCALPARRDPEPQRLFCIGGSDHLSQKS